MFISCFRPIEPKAVLQKQGIRTCLNVQLLICHESMPFTKVETILYINCQETQPVYVAVPICLFGGGCFVPDVKSWIF